MDIRQQRILDYLVAYWREQFNLVPAADLSEVFHILDVETLETLDAMAKDGVVELYRRQADPGALDVPKISPAETVQATYVLPSRSILEARFQEANEDFGPYRNLLLQGVRQDEFFRFRPPILDHYRQNPDVELTPELIVTKHTAIQRDMHPVYVRYRWATGPSGDRTIVVNLWDLAELSQTEQAIWARHEIEELRGDGG